MRKNRVWRMQLVAIAFLLFALLPLPHGYYMLLRIICCAIFVYVGIMAHSNKKEVVAYLCYFVAILYNPLLIIHFNRDVWEVINVLTMLFAVFTMYAVKTEAEFSAPPDPAPYAVPPAESQLSGVPVESDNQEGAEDPLPETPASAPATGEEKPEASTANSGKGIGCLPLFLMCVAASCLGRVVGLPGILFPLIAWAIFGEQPLRKAFPSIGVFLYYGLGVLSAFSILIFAWGSGVGSRPASRPQIGAWPPASSSRQVRRDLVDSPKARPEPHQTIRGYTRDLTIPCPPGAFYDEKENELHNSLKTGPLFERALTFVLPADTGQYNISRINEQAIAVTTEIFKEFSQEALQDLEQPALRSSLNDGIDALLPKIMVGKGTVRLVDIKVFPLTDLYCAYSCQLEYLENGRKTTYYTTTVYFFFDNTIISLSSSDFSSQSADDSLDRLLDWMRHIIQLNPVAAEQEIAEAPPAGKSGRPEPGVPPEGEEQTITLCHDDWKISVPYPVGSGHEVLRRDDKQVDFIVDGVRSGVLLYTRKVSPEKFLTMKNAQIARGKKGMQGNNAVSGYTVVRNTDTLLIAKFIGTLNQTDTLFFNALVFMEPYVLSVRLFPFPEAIASEQVLENGMRSWCTRIQQHHAAVNIPADRYDKGTKVKRLD